MAVRSARHTIIISKANIQPVMYPAQGPRKRRVYSAKEPEIDVTSLHAKIGQLTLENDFLEGALAKAGLLPSAKR